MPRLGQSRNVVLVLIGAIACGAIFALMQPEVRTSKSHNTVNTEVVETYADTKDAVVAPVQVVTTSANVPLDPPHVPETLAFEERENGVYEAVTGQYSAKLSAADGLRYQPEHGDHDKTELSIRLKSVKRGATATFERDGKSEANTNVMKNGSAVSLWHTPSFAEKFEARGDGVEQSFLLEAPPSGSGALEFVCDVQTTGLQAISQGEGRNGGVQFKDGTGRVAAKYGQVMVRDAAKKALVVEPKFDAAAKQIAFSVPAAWLDKAEYPVVVDPLVGNNLFISSQSNTVGVTQPTICAGTNNFLMVWNDYSNGSNKPRLTGRVINTDGSQGALFYISNAVSVPLNYRNQRIQAAYDGTNWMVVWSDDRTTGFGIRGAIVSNGGNILSGSDFQVAPTSGLLSNEDPLVSYDGSSFICAWTSTPSGSNNGSQVYYSRVTYTGTTISPGVVNAIKFASSATQSLEYLVSQRGGGDSLIIYTELNEVPAQHRAVRLAQNGNQRDDVGIVLFKENVVVDKGFGAPIGAVFNNNEWQILSCDNQTKDNSIYLHRMSLAGVVTPPTGVFAEFGQGATGYASLDTLSPAVPGANEWLFLREEKINSNLYHIIGKRVMFDGTDMDPIWFTVDNATRGLQYGGVAAQAGNSFLVGWVDGRDSTLSPPSNLDIYGALIDAVNPTTGTALKALIAVSPKYGEAPLAVAFDAGFNLPIGSTGSYDSIVWDFGDGAAPVSEKNLISPTHTYKYVGTYLATLKLTKGSYSILDRVVIKVGIGTDGPPTQLGVPLASSSPIVANSYVTGLTIAVDFKNGNNDKVTLTGVYDVGSFNGDVSGQSVTLALGAATSTFTLNSAGKYTTDSGVIPSKTFSIDPKTGVYKFTIASGSIGNEMMALGLTATAGVATIKDIPVSIGVGAAPTTMHVGGSYVYSSTTKVGTLTYVLLGTGNEVSGVFYITNFAATENINTTHTFTGLRGKLIVPGGFTKAAAGFFHISLGNYTDDIPVADIKQTGASISYTAKVTKTSGVKLFTLNTTTGIFSINFASIPNAATGLPLAKSGTNIVSVNLNLSFNFDTTGGALTTGRYIYIKRVNSATKTWTLR